MMLDGIYRFGHFSISPAERRLYEHDRELTLPPKAFDALLLLVRREGALLSRPEIIHSLWPDTHVSEANLTNIIVLLRKLLGRGVIQTVSKFGYRLTLPVTGEPGVKQATYAAFTRAKELASERTLDSLHIARDMFWVCLAEDPQFAQAWAWLGRTCRLLDKFTGAHAGGSGLAESAFQRAFLIDPDLACAHQFFTQLQIDAGHAEQAMVRLANRLKSRGEDPETLSALVQVFRCCGLLRESVAAHERAIVLDPVAKTSVAHTYFLLGDYQKVFENYTGFRFYLDAATWVGLGERKHAATLLRERLARPENGSPMRETLSSLLAILEGRAGEAVAIMERAEPYLEPEAIFYFARQCAMADAVGPTVCMVRNARLRGFSSALSLQTDPVFQTMRSHPDFDQEYQQSKLVAERASQLFHHEIGYNLPGGWPRSRF